MSNGTPVTANVGSYPITPSSATGTGLTNYTITYVNGTDTVTAAPLTITANNATKVYGSSQTFAPTAFTSSGLVNGDTITGVTETSTGTVPSATVAGSTYPIIPSAANGTGLSNYTITYVNGKDTVTAAPLTITANNATKVYGTTATFATTAFTSNGLLNIDTIAGVNETSTGAPATAAVGSYPISPSAATGTGLSNYTITYVNGTLTVNSATGTISGHKYLDTTGNGLAAGETGLSGVTIDLYTDSNHSGSCDTSTDTKVASRVTDSNGAYSFSGIAPGTYFVQEQVPSGYVQTAPNGPSSSNYYTVTISPTSLTSISNDFADFLLGCCQNTYSNPTYQVNGVTVVVRPKNWTGA